MKMKHFLPAALAGVDHSTKTIVQSLFFCQLGCQQQHLAEQGGMGIFGLHQRSQMKLGDQHEVHRCDRVDVMKGEQLIVFIHLAARNFTVCNFTKQTVAHAQSFLRLTFSATPDKPSRLVSSFSTSAALTPCCANSTMQWN